MALSTLSFPSLSTFIRFLAGEGAARDEIRTFLRQFLTNAQAVETATAAAQVDATAGIADAATAQAAADAAQADATQALADAATGIADAATAQADATQALADAATADAKAVDVGQRADNQVCNSGQITDGTTAGKLKTVADVSTRVWGKLYFKAATDDLWDLSAKIDTIAAKYRAYWLYLDSAGNASVETDDESGATDSDSEVAAIVALPAWDTTKCVVGAYVAGPSTDFNNVAGLAAQGTIVNGWPSSIV